MIINGQKYNYLYLYNFDMADVEYTDFSTQRDYIRLVFDYTPSFELVFDVEYDYIPVEGICSYLDIKMFDSIDNISSEEIKYFEMTNSESDYKALLNVIELWKLVPEEDKLKLILDKQNDN